MESETLGVLSLLPASVAILLAFITRNTVFSLAVACLVGVVMVPIVMRDRILSRSEGGIMAVAYLLYLVMSGGS